MTIALLQTKVDVSKEENLENAARMAGKASENGAKIAVLPEIFNCPYETERFSLYAEDRDGKTYKTLSGIAKENGLLLIGGSIPERSGEKLYNTSFVFDAQGREIAYHRKAHLFDINIEGRQAFRESDVFSPGDKATVFEYEGHKIGLAICFDIRFPGLFAKMAQLGAEAVIVPAAFNMTTGPLHWELLFRTRAVDNQLFMFGCAPARMKNGKYVSYGHSIAVDPWGKILADGGEDEGITVADFDFAEVDSVRRQLPVLSARRTELY